MFESCYTFFGHRSLNHQQTWTVNGVGVDGKYSDFHDPWAWIMYGQKTLKKLNLPKVINIIIHYPLFFLKIF